MKQSLFAVPIVFLFLLILFAQEKQLAVSNAVNRPERTPFQQQHLKLLKVPEGFTINVFATGTGKPRMMAVSDDGTAYVTRPDQSDVITLRDKNGDGTSDETKTIVKDLKGVHGITIRGNQLYLCTVRELYQCDLNGQGLRKLISDLPEGGQHPNRTLAFGPDDLLYISIGSTCNACDETNKENATILQAKPDGSGRQVFAKGLRNTIGFGWHPQTKAMWGMDHGSDGRGDDIPDEELNLLQQGKDYGWPYCLPDKKPDPFSDNPKGTTKEAYCAKSTAATLGYQAHSAPIEMKFYRGTQFPPEYKDNAFVAMHGSWNRTVAVGFKVVRILFVNGQPQKFEDFVTGFLIDRGKRHFGRPAGLAIAGDGSLLISDDSNGVIYSVSYSPKK